MSESRLTSLPALLTFRGLNGVVHGISTRHGGVSKAPYQALNLGLSTRDERAAVLENRRLFFRSLGLVEADVLVGRLSHGNRVTIFHVDSNPRNVDRRAPDGAPFFCSDAVVSNVPGLHFMVTAADCVPIAFADRKSGAVGAAHSGWRGTALAIASEVVRTMEMAFRTDPAHLSVGIGPSIGPCCYSVSPEVLDRFAAAGHEAVTEEREGKTYLDLWTTNERQLTRAGVPESKIENPRICTSCNVDDFYSHRREGGATGRFALCIGI